MCANPTFCCDTGPGDEAVGGAPAEGSGEVVVEPPPEQAEDTPALGSGAAVVVPPPEIAKAPAVGSGEAVPEPPPENVDAPAVGSSEAVAEPPLGDMMSGDETTEPFENAIESKGSSDRDSD